MGEQRRQGGGGARTLLPRLVSPQQSLQGVEARTPLTPIYVMGSQVEINAQLVRRQYIQEATVSERVTVTQRSGRSR